MCAPFRPALLSPVPLVATVALVEATISADLPGHSREPVGVGWAVAQRLFPERRSTPVLGAPWRRSPLAGRPAPRWRLAVCSEPATLVGTGVQGAAGVVVQAPVVTRTVPPLALATVAQRRSSVLPGGVSLSVALLCVAVALVSLVTPPPLVVVPAGEPVHRPAEEAADLLARGLLVLRAEIRAAARRHGRRSGTGRLVHRAVRRGVGRAVRVACVAFGKSAARVLGRHVGALLKRSSNDDRHHWRYRP